MEKTKIIIGIIFGLLFGFINFINLWPNYASNNSVNESLSSIKVNGMPVNFFQNGFDAIEFAYDPVEDKKMQTGLMELENDRYEFPILKQQHLNNIFDLINDISKAQPSDSNNEIQPDFTSYYNKLANEENDKTAYLYSENYFSIYENILLDDDKHLEESKPNEYGLTFSEEFSRMFAIDYEFEEVDDFKENIRSREDFEKLNKLQNPSSMNYDNPEFLAKSIYNYNNMVIVDEIYLLPQFGSYIPNLAIDYPNSVLEKIKDMSPYGRASWYFTIITKWLMCLGKIPTHSKITAGECFSTYKYLKMIQEKQCKDISHLFIDEEIIIYALCMNKFYIEMIELIDKDKMLSLKTKQIIEFLRTNDQKNYENYVLQIEKLIQVYFENSYQF